mgnify:CR=1 FL=1
MNRYDEHWNHIRADAAAVDLAARRQEWANRRTVVTTIRAAAEGHLQRLSDESEAIRRLLATSQTERAKMLSDIIDEETQRRTLGAGVHRPLDIEAI